EKHAVTLAALVAAERDRDDLPAFGVVAEAGRVRHTDELKLDQRFVELEWRGDNSVQFFRVGTVRDDEIFTMDKAGRANWIVRARQRHREGPLPHLTFRDSNLARLAPAIAGLVHWRNSSSYCSRFSNYFSAELPRSNMRIPSGLSGRCSTSGCRRLAMASSYPDFQCSSMVRL